MVYNRKEKAQFLNMNVPIGNCMITLKTLGTSVTK